MRDDGSYDKTLEILNYYNIKPIESVKNIGAKKSFSKLLEYAIENTESEYFMFCDQDDVWNPDKIKKTISKMIELEQRHGDIPFLVHTDLEVVDERLNTINSSFMNFQKINFMKNKFHNLLMQNTITGCTIMINRKLAEKCIYIPNNAIMHDLWIGLVASKFGKIGYLNECTIKYRQHNNNTIGANGFSYFEIIRKGLDFFYKININSNILQANVFLKHFENELDVETIKMLQEFITLNQKNWLQKRIILLKYKLLKQGFVRNLGLFLKI